LATIVVSTPTPQATQAVPILKSPHPEWKIPATGRFILVNQLQQLMYIYEDGVQIKIIPCSTGAPNLHLTPAWSGRVGNYQGTFQANGFYADDAWFLFYDSGAILIHSSPYVYVNGEKRYQELEALGRYPTSHGCIRIHPDDARWLTAWNPAGVRITITPWRGSLSP